MQPAGARRLQKAKVFWFFCHKTAHAAVWINISRSLPEELRAELPNARSASASDVPETPIVKARYRVDVIVTDISARIRELGMVEDVEEFGSDFKGFLFRDRDSLRYPQVGVVDAGAVEEPPVRRTESSAVRARKVGNRIEGAAGRGKRGLIKIRELRRAGRIARVPGVNWPHQVRHINSLGAGKG